MDDSKRLQAAKRLSRRANVCCVHEMEEELSADTARFRTIHSSKLRSTITKEARGGEVG